MSHCARIIGTGGYWYEHIVSKAGLEKTADASGTCIKEGAGIKQRHIAAVQVGTAYVEIADCEVFGMTARKSGMSMDKVVQTVARRVNTSAVFIPLALDVAVRGGCIRAGDTLLMEGFGGEFTWGSALANW